MRLFTQLLPFTVLLPLLSCNSDTATQEEKLEQFEKVTEVNQDSLRNLYRQKLKAKDETLPSQQIPEKGKLNPVDEAVLDTAFFLFREDLLVAIEQKNIFGLLEAVDENIKCSFGAENGLADFVRMWGLESEEKVKDSQVWTILQKILTQGGTFDNRRTGFTAPYIFSTFPDEYDSFQYSAIAGGGVRLRNAPTLNSKILKSISYDIVEVIERTDKMEIINGETHPWIKIKMLDGLEGYVYGQFVQSPIDFRAGFSKDKDERWKMTFLLAGD